VLDLINSFLVRVSLEAFSNLRFRRSSHASFVAGFPPIASFPFTFTVCRFARLSAARSYSFFSLITVLSEVSSSFPDGIFIPMVLLHLTPACFPLFPFRFLKNISSLPDFSFLPVFSLPPAWLIVAAQLFPLCDDWFGHFVPVFADPLSCQAQEVSFFFPLSSIFSRALKLFPLVSLFFRFRRPLFHCRVRPPSPPWCLSD